MIPRKLLDEIERWQSEKKYGHLQINFSEGKIVNVNRVESIKIVQLGMVPVQSVSVNGSVDSVNI